MYNKEDLAGLFGMSDEGFRTNFDNTLTKLRNEENVSSVRRTHWKMITVIVVFCVIAMTGVAYAVSQYNLRIVGQVDDADVGAAWKLVSVPENYYESIGEGIWQPLYYNYNNTKLENPPQFTAEAAQALRKLLANNIFTADGYPFDLLVLDPDSNEYYADDRGLVLYCNGGYCRIDNSGTAIYDKAGYNDMEELAEIYYSAIGYNGEPIGLEISSIAWKDKQREAELVGEYGIKTTTDYAEAARLLGQEFRLPTAYIEGLAPPEYRIQEGFTQVLQNEITGELEDGDEYGTAVYVRIKGDPGMYYFAEVKTENNASREWYATGAVIEECVIAETTVYRVINDDMIRYTWEHDGLVYMIFQDKTDQNEFTDEQFAEIIWSMIQ